MDCHFCGRSRSSASTCDGCGAPVPKREDMASRIRLYQLHLASGFLSIDAVRRLEGLPPLEAN